MLKKLFDFFYKTVCGNSFKEEDHLDYLEINKWLKKLRRGELKEPPPPNGTLEIEFWGETNKSKINRKNYEIIMKEWRKKYARK